MNTEESAGKIIEESAEARPWSELATSGLLWLINTSVLHPRGYALAIGFNDDGECDGWRIVGDGSEPWQFGCDDETQKMLDERFKAIRDLLP